MKKLGDMFQATSVILRLTLVLLMSFCAGLVFANPGSSTVCFSHPAMQEVKTTTDKILVELEAVRNQIKANPKVVYGIIDRLMVPKADFRVMSRLVLTRNWKGLSEVQKNNFTKEFSKLMIRTYGVAFESYDGETVEYSCPIRDLPGNMPRVEVKTTIHSLNRPDSVVKFRLLERNKTCISCKTTISSCKAKADECLALKDQHASEAKLDVCKKDYDTCKLEATTCKSRCDICQACEEKPGAEGCGQCNFEWLVYDLIIDNISIIDSYRQIYTDKFRQERNADKIIADMHAKNCKDNFFCS